MAPGVLLTLSAPAVRAAWAARGGGRTIPVLIGLLGVGLIGSGLFAADPVAAGATAAFPYPPGQPVIAARTAHGILHDLCGTPVFLGLPLLRALSATGTCGTGISALPATASG